jgi:hypothetical protein
LLAIAALTWATTAAPAPSSGDIKKGDKLQTLANLHPDMQRHLLYTLNYQLPGLIPVCSEVTITEVHNKKLAFLYQGTEFELEYDSFSKNAGISFQKAAQTFLGPACDKAKMQSLGKIDQDGIRNGRPHVGMTREGVLFAMGRPPYHVNMNLEADEWMYWRNRYGKLAVAFGDDGTVSNIR